MEGDSNKQMAEADIPTRKRWIRVFLPDLILLILTVLLSTLSYQAPLFTLPIFLVFIFIKARNYTNNLTWSNVTTWTMTFVISYLLGFVLSSFYYVSVWKNHQELVRKGSAVVTVWVVVWFVGLDGVEAGLKSWFAEWQKVRESWRRIWA